MTAPADSPPSSLRAEGLKGLRAEGLKTVPQLPAEPLNLGHSNSGLREGFTTFPIALRGSASTT